MKLINVATLVAVCAAGRLEHLERSYLPPDNSLGVGSDGGSQNGSQNGSHNGFGSNGGSHNGFGSNGGSHNGYGTNGGSQNGFGSNGAHGSLGSFGSNGFYRGSFGSVSSSKDNGFGSNGGSHGAFGSNVGSGSDGQGFGTNSNGFGAATSNQYLPPNRGQSGSSGSSRNGFSSFRAPSTQYGTPSIGNNNGFGGQGTSSQFQQSQSHESQPQFGVSNQYLTSKQYSNFQNIPQQSFDEQTGYHY